jgi:hypothetical protein
VENSVNLPPGAPRTPGGAVPSADHDPAILSRRDPAYTVAAAVLAFLAGAFGLMALYGLRGDPWQHHGELAVLHAILAMFIGALARGRWYVSIIVAWGAMVWGLPLAAIFGEADWRSTDTWTYAVYGYAIVVPVTIAGGYLGSWLVGKIVR